MDEATCPKKGTIQTYAVHSPMLPIRKEIFRHKLQWNSEVVWTWFLKNIGFKMKFPDSPKMYRRFPYSTVRFTAQTGSVLPKEKDKNYRVLLSNGMSINILMLVQPVVLLQESTWTFVMWHFRKPTTWDFGTPSIYFTPTHWISLRHYLRRKAAIKHPWYFFKEKTLEEKNTKKCM